ncbi:MAG TPA: hypothetical protein DCY13_07365 [Verrucomicrobiales bacterium]|nr:hypothetical protein [Verrucomicrobiales bacterium]
MRLPLLLAAIVAGSTFPALPAVESWSDPRLPVKQDLAIWLDATRQREAYREEGTRPLFDGGLFPNFRDASGHGRDFVQPAIESMPRFASRGAAAWIQFDGTNDFLASHRADTRFTNVTVFIVAAPHSNAGMFRCLISAAQSGENDYSSGLNLDLGPGPGLSFGTLNVEGAGAGGMVNLLEEQSRFGTYRRLTLTSAAGDTGIRLFADGKAQASRAREASTFHAEHMLLGARLYSNQADPPHASGHFAGDIAEVLVFARTLSDPERAEVEGYLSAKHASLLEPTSTTNGGFDPLAPVLKPPAVQMLLPGFEPRELPVKLPNINGVKYRLDGKLVALGYNGKIYLLSDTDRDGLEDTFATFWDTNSLRAPIGMALTPPGYVHGQGVFVAAKGKVSLIVDKDGDDRADEEIVIAQGWRELSHGVDALGVAMDKDGAVYFGLGVADFTNPYLIDRATSQSRFDLDGERGTILRISPDLKSREIVARGIRFPVALAFNSEGDLFCTDQEGATWLPNGNPLDELLHVVPDRYYGFPPRHPRHLPGVIDEPSTFDFGPQHQSLCGLNFNPAPGAGRVFGPERWAGDALIAGYSRGKLYRTKLVKTEAGYVADSQMLAALSLLTVDMCVSPRGDLVVATHSGQPDWGSGPTGEGRLFQIRHVAPELPQPALVWAASAGETHVAFDRPLTPEQARRLAGELAVAAGKHIVAGERFETLRPGYQVVQDQFAAERFTLPVLSSQLTADRRTLVIQTPRRNRAVNYTVTLGALELEQTGQTNSHHSQIDLAHSLHGVEASLVSDAGERRIWLPHFDLAVARELTAGSAEHEAFWQSIPSAGSLTLRAQLDLWQMLRPAVQPGSKIDYELPVEDVVVTFRGRGEFAVRNSDTSIPARRDSDGTFSVSLKKTVEQDQWLPMELVMTARSAAPSLTVSWHTSEDPRPRPLPLHRTIVPWAARESAEDAGTASQLPPEIAGANWLRGRRIFFGEQAACSTCHQIRGEGHLVGPDLSNLVHRDHQSVLKDIVSPNATINPDHISYEVELNDGDTVSGVLRSESAESVTLAQAGGRVVKLAKDQIRSMSASSLSLMPEGLHAAIGPEGTHDLMKFLLTSPLEPAVLKSEAPAIRSVEELDLVARAAAIPPDSRRPLRVLLVAGPKDHGPDEHDYPLWQERWAKLLAMADNVTVTSALGWPSLDALESADVAVFYSNNPGWTAAGAAQLEAFQARGGGLVYIHFAVDGHQAVRELSDRIGLAWRSGSSKFRHGPLTLTVDSTHPIMEGLSTVQFFDESYWNLEGDPRSVWALATGLEGGQPRPLMWTRVNGKGRVFVSIPGHYTWTFDDPLFRLILLRGICWAAHEPVDRLAELATPGARMNAAAEPAN